MQALSQAFMGHSLAVLMFFPLRRVGCPGSMLIGVQAESTLPSQPRSQNFSSILTHGWMKASDRQSSYALILNALCFLHLTTQARKRMLLIKCLEYNCNKEQ